MMSVYLENTNTDIKIYQRRSIPNCLKRTLI